MSSRYTTPERVLLVTFWAMIAAGPAACVRDAVERAQQSHSVKRTIADMSADAAAWEARAEDLRHYNAARDAAVAVPGGPGFPRTISGAVLTGMLVPKYTAHFVRRDGWGHDLEFRVDDTGENYMIRSPGRDGIFQTFSGEPCASWDCDLVWFDGEFITRFGDQPAWRPRG